MDIVNYTDGSGGGDDPAASPPTSAEGRVNLCPLCDALNGPSSRGCSNCGWHGAIYGNALGGRLAWLRVRSAVFHMSRWRDLRTRLHPAHGLPPSGADTQMG